MKKKYHLIKWEKICKSKKKGGLGIKNLSKMNMSLLTKWWWKLENEMGLWQEIIKFKYLKNDTIQSVSHRLNDSACWSDLLKIKEIFLLGREICTKKGDLTRFWKDKWLYQQPLCVLVPELFELCECKDTTVEKNRSGQIQISFRRWLPWDLRIKWEQIWEDVISFPLDDRADMILWSLEKNKKFSVKSTYSALTSTDAGLYNKRIWKGKIPTKIKIFMWLLTKNAILTKDNLIKRKWKGNPDCYFCNNVENMSHLFF